MESWQLRRASRIQKTGLLRAKHRSKQAIQTESYLFAVLFIMAVLIFSSPSAALAQTRIKTSAGSSIVINAQNASRDFDNQITTLSGGVQIVYEQQYISCDRAIINQKTEEIIAEGNLIISTPQAYIEGDRAVMNYRTNTGTIYNGFVKSGQVLFEGNLVRKTGPDTYEAEAAEYTACTTCPPAWSFSGTQIKAEIGGYAYIKNSVLEVGNVPVFWLPYLIVPLKSERQTGLLIPSFNFSGSGGAAVGIPFFWAISRSQDATFTLKNYSNRGLKGLANYRYVLTEASYGELNFATIRDRIFGSDADLRAINPNLHSNRWFLNYAHQYDLPYGFTQRTKLNLVSDLRYPRDFPEEILGQGEPALENRVSLTRNTPATHSSLDVSYYINQLQTDPSPNTGSTVQRWPEFRFHIIENEVAKSGLLFNLGVNYVNFAREDYAYDDVITIDGRREIDTTRRAGPGGGVFNPDVDLIRTGQRFDFLPELSYPFHLGLLDVLPAVQFRHTQYSFNVSPPEGSSFDPSPYRQFMQGRLSLRSRFYRIYGDQSFQATPEPNTPLKPVEKPLERPSIYRHEVEPEVVFTGIPYRHNTGSSFFSEEAQIPVFLDNQPISDSDFQSDRRIQFDYHDRLSNRNTIGFILGNRIVRKSWENGIPTYKQIASLRVGQSYDFDEAQSQSSPRFPWSDISALLDLRFDHFSTNTELRYFPYHNVTNTSSRVRMMNDRQDFFELSFNQTFLITERVEEAYPRRDENIGLSAGFNTKYLTFAGIVNTKPEEFAPLRVAVKSWSTYLNFKPPGDCWGIRLTIQQQIGGELSQFIDFDYKFGGESI